MIQWHWVSSAICLIGMLLFAITGITLNHAGQIESKPTVEQSSKQLPADLLLRLNERQTDQRQSDERQAELANSGDELSQDELTAPISAEVAKWLSNELGLSIGNRAAEWSDDEVYVSLAGPGADAWISIDRTTGQFEFERTWRGWIAYFNDLHKGRHTGAAWSWFLDILAGATLVFCFSGLFLLYVHSKNRQLTWPLVGLGLVAPMLIALLFVH